jgi:hypothetical protein
MTRLKRRSLFNGPSALAFALAILAAEAAFPFEGRYVAGDKSYRQELAVTRRADGRFNVTAVVGTLGCSGFVDNAVGAADGDTLKAEGKEGAETCVLVLRRTKKGVSVEEDDRCIDFHGPSCEFRGDYRKRR